MLDGKAGSEKTYSRRTGLSSQDRSKRGGYQKSISQSEISRFFKKAGKSNQINADTSMKSIKKDKQDKEEEGAADLRASANKPSDKKRASTAQ